MPRVPTPASPTAPSCDRCRARKVKCIASETERCRGCTRAGVECTHDYVHKKPGRPLGSRRRSTPMDTMAAARAPGTSTRIRAVVPDQPGNGQTGISTATTTETQTEAGRGGEEEAAEAGPASGSIFGSARTAMATYPSTADGHGHGVPVAVPLSVLDATQWRAPVPLLSAPVASVPIEIDGVNTDLLDIDTNADADADTAADPASENPSTEAYASGQDLDAVLPWTDACFFLTLFLRDQHCLVPVVHKPSFAQSLLARADKTDDALRGLVCSIIAFTICQCPISSMIGAGYARPRLVSILGRCRRAAEAVRTRQRMSRRPSLVLLSSALLDWITAQAVGDPQSTELHIAETTRLAHALGLHAAGAGPSGSGSGVDTETDTVERELRHRLYWIIYSKDKTDALSGRPLILHDFEGLPPLPLQVDDDYITPAGHLPQPTGRTSYMVGVVAIARIFRVISQCVVRHRAFANANVSPGGEGGDEGDDDDRADREAEVELHLAWTRVAQQRLHAILAGLPATLRTNLAEMAEMAAPESPGGGGGRLFGIQQANITITALCAEFALLDLRAALRPDEDTRAEREEVARNAYATLSSIPYEYLASNGESMRGKVLRTILSLLSTTPEPVTLSQDVWDWWNMYSRVQFLQVIPDEAMLLIDQTQTQANGSASGAGAARADKLPSPIVTSL